jgi:hypothetical protein
MERIVESAALLCVVFALTLGAPIPTHAEAGARCQVHRERVQLKLGDGMWGPKVVLGSYKLYFADPKTGQVGFYGSIEEHGHPAILGLRLKIEDRKIGEMEAIALLLRSPVRHRLHQGDYPEVITKGAGAAVPGSR